MRKIIIGVVSLLAVLVLAGNLLAFGGNTGMTSNFWKMSSGDLVPTTSSEKIKVYDLEVTNAFTLGGTVGTGGIDMNGEVITNIGDAGTDFGSSGELTLASSLTVGSDILSDTAATDSIGSEAVYWLKAYLGSDISFEGSTDDDFQTTISFTDPTTPDKTITFQDADGIVAMDATAVTDLEGTALSITTGTLNVTEADPLSALKALSNLASVAINESLISDTAAIDNLGSEALYWLKGFFGSELSFEGATDDDYQTTLSFTDTTTADRTITFQDADGIVATDATAVTDLEGTKLSITTGTLNVTETDPLSATMALNNIASSAINTSLISDTADTDNLGSADKEWLNAYIGDAGKIHLGLGQDATIHRNATNELTLTATSGINAAGFLTVTETDAGNLKTQVRHINSSNTVGTGARLSFRMLDSNSAVQTYGRIGTEIDVNTAGSVDGTMRMSVYESGSAVDYLILNGNTENVSINKDLNVVGKYSATADADTIADSGDENPATATLQPATSYVSLTCSDVHTCDITMSETGVTDGQIVRITNVSANDCDFADTAGVSELAGAFAMGQYDTLELLYATDRWVEISRSNN